MSATTTDEVTICPDCSGTPGPAGCLYCSGTGLVYQDALPVQRPDVKALKRLHVPAPRHRKSDPIQCQKDLTIWPCVVRQLVDMLERQART